MLALILELHSAVIQVKPHMWEFVTELDADLKNPHRSKQEMLDPVTESIVKSPQTAKL